MVCTKKGQANYKEITGLELKYQNDLDQTRLSQATELSKVISGARKMNKEQLMLQQRLRGNIPFSEVAKNQLLNKQSLPVFTGRAFYLSLVDVCLLDNPSMSIFHGQC